MISRVAIAGLMYQGSFPFCFFHVDLPLIVRPSPSGRYEWF